MVDGILRPAAAAAEEEEWGASEMSLTLPLCESTGGGVEGGREKAPEQQNFRERGRAYYRKKRERGRNPHHPLECCSSLTFSSSSTFPGATAGKKRREWKEGGGAEMGGGGEKFLHLALLLPMPATESR